MVYGGIVQFLFIIILDRHSPHFHISTKISPIQAKHCHLKKHKLQSHLLCFLPKFTSFPFLCQCQNLKIFNFLHLFPFLLFYLYPHPMSMVKSKNNHLIIFYFATVAHFAILLKQNKLFNSNLLILTIFYNPLCLAVQTYPSRTLTII